MRNRKRSSVSSWRDRWKTLDMFGKGMTIKELKNMKIKGLALKIIAIVVCILLLYIFFSFTPDHFALHLPEEADLAKSPQLRAPNKWIEADTVRRHTIQLLEDHCEAHQDFDILFCHNIQLNNVPLFSPCFMLCNTKEFYYNLKVLQTDEVQKIVCVESYSTIEQRVERDKLVLIQGYKGMDLQQFSMIPNTTLSSCLLQHANDVSRGRWV